MSYLSNVPGIKLMRRIVSCLIMSAFLLTSVFPIQSSYAQSVLNLPSPDALLGQGDVFMPATIKGMTVYPENPLKFDFIVNSGDERLAGDVLSRESMRLIKYFLASLTVPENDLWVNLSPYEKNRIIADSLGATEMGRDLLAQDYVLKQLSSSMMYPEDALGAAFWKRVYQKAQEQFGSTDIPLSTFNKIWIVPSKAVVYQNGNSAFVVENHLKVMLEADYLAMEKMGGVSVQESTPAAEMQSAIIKEVLIPEIEKEVNQGKNFAALRQMANAIVLATWYKKNLKESLLGQVYVDKAKTKGVDVADAQVNQQIYEQYLEAFKTGVYNYVKEEYDAASKQTIARKYFSGGAKMKYDGAMVLIDAKNMTRDQAELVANGIPGDGNTKVTWFATENTHGFDFSETAKADTELLILPGVPAKEPGEFRIGVLTSGGLAPHNPAIVAIVEEAKRIAEETGRNIKVVGIPFGWKGAASDPEKLRKTAGILELKEADTLGRIGGSMLGSERGNPTSDEKTANAVRLNIETTLELDVVISAGGDDTNRGSAEMLKKFPDLKVKVLGIPKTMDNDLQTGDSNNYGFATFVQRTAQRAINLRASAKQQGRMMVMEVASRAAGFTAYEIGGMVGALRSFGPEEGSIDILKLKDQLSRYFAAGGEVGPIVISEGVSIEEDSPEFKDNEFTDLEHMTRVYNKINRELLSEEEVPAFDSRTQALEFLNSFFSNVDIIRKYAENHKTDDLGKEGEYYFDQVEDVLNAKVSAATISELETIAATPRVKRLIRIILEQRVADCPKNNQEIIWQAVQKNPGIKHYLYPTGKRELDPFGHPKLEGIGEILTAILGVIVPKIKTSLEGKALYGEREASPVTEDIFITRKVGEAVVKAAISGENGKLFYVDEKKMVVARALETELGGRIAKIGVGERDRMAFEAGNSLLFGENAFVQSVAFAISKVEREYNFGYNSMSDGKPIITEDRLVELKAYLNFIVRRINGYANKNGKEAAKALGLFKLKVEALEWWGKLEQRLIARDYEHDMVMEREYAAMKKGKSATDAAAVGGINLDPKLFDLQIKRDGKGIPLPTNQQILDEAKIAGFAPVIVSVQPARDLVGMLGLELKK